MAIASNNRASHSPPESARLMEVATGTAWALTPGLAGGAASGTPGAAVVRDGRRRSACRPSS